MSVNQGNGNVDISAVLDPSDSNCYSYNVGAAITLNLSGQAYGYHDSRNGTGKTQYGPVTYTFNFQEDCFGEILNGPGFGTFYGEACASRNNNRYRIP